MILERVSKFIPTSCTPQWALFGQGSFEDKRGSSSGSMIFICILFVAFYIEMTQKRMEQKARGFLIQSACTDELTQRRQSDRGNL